MYYVKVDVNYITVIQVISAHSKVPILIANPHASSPAIELNFKVVENLLWFLAKYSSDSLNLLETYEIICKRISQYVNVAQYLNLQSRIHSYLSPMIPVSVITEFDNLLSAQYK